MRARKTVIALSCAVAIAAGAAACGTAKQLSAAEQVSDGFDKLGAAKSVKVSFSLDATPAQLVALAGTSAADKLKLTDATKLSGLGATVTLSSAGSVQQALKVLQDPKATGLPAGSALAMEVHAGDGKPLVEIREIGEKAYVRIGLDQIVSLSGDASMRTEIAQMRAGMAQMPAAYSAVKDLFEDKWVGIDVKAAGELAKNAPTTGLPVGITPSAAPSLDAATRTKLSDAVIGVFKKDVAFTDKGSKDGVQQIQVAAPARQLVTDLQGAVLPIVRTIPGVGSKLPTGAPTDVPDKQAAAEVFLKDGVVTKVTMDLNQLDPAGAGQQLPVSLSFALDAPAVTAPAGASELTSGVLQDMLKGMGSQS
ncbi:hypothetical protein [Streptacidiphilus rugosus]|uniref:hypothetical protein n=1 Tax=Streptacidiphilus rugosus TaxID=405783 RepID=UPI00056C6CED|nr:hypothetical protein [Streptacidiphilus rugosus]